MLAMLFPLASGRDRDALVDGKSGCFGRSHKIRTENPPRQNAPPLGGAERTLHLTDWLGVCCGRTDHVPTALTPLGFSGAGAFSRESALRPPP